MTRLFDQYRLGDIVLRNRVVMAPPMTRARSVDTIAGAHTAEYYRQRATAGLIVTEGTPISPPKAKATRWFRESGPGNTLPAGER